MMTEPAQLYTLIIEASNRNPAAPAMLAPGKKASSFELLVQHLFTVIHQVSRWGFTPSDRLALVLPNGPESATAFLALSQVSTCAPLNPAYPYQDFHFSLQDLKVRAVITSFGEEHPAYQVARALQIPVIQLIPDPLHAGLYSLSSDLRPRMDITQPLLAELDDTALVLHTSGTTSRPKIVPLSHRNLFHSTRNIIDTYQLSPADRCLNMMPLFHVHGLMAAVTATLVSGGSVVCTPGFSADQVLDWFSLFQPTWYTVVPSIHNALAEQAARDVDRVSNHHLRFIRSCSSALPPVLAQKLEDIFTVPVLEAYGMTEGTHQIASNPLPPAARKPGSVGKPTGRTQAAILDGQGNLLQTGETGEICIRGENVISGYENNPQANASNFINGWLRTGDQGYMDHEGYLFITGRIKEIINRGGEKISPREIDEVLLQHPAVQQAVAFAIPHPSLGEDVAAAVVLRPSSACGMQELRQFAAGKLADFKVPRLILVLEDLPKGPTGKVQRVGMAEKLKFQLAQVRELDHSDGSEPGTPLETALLPLWRSVFEIQEISINDDFLALGGDSIMAARLLLQVERELGVSLSLRDIFTAPTISSMAVLIQELKNGSNEP